MPIPATAALYQRFKLVREELQRTLDWHNGAFAEQAEAISGHLAVDAVQRVDVGSGRMSFFNHPV